MRTRKYNQADLDYWLVSFVIRGRDHTPDWVTVSKLLRLGANPTARVKNDHRDYSRTTAVRVCQKMVEAYDPDHGRMLEGWRCSPERARQICRKTQAHFQGYLNQFAKAGYAINNR
jgi:hypothetical protein